MFDDKFVSVNVVCFYAVCFRVRKVHAFEKGRSKTSLLLFFITAGLSRAMGAAPTAHPLPPPPPPPPQKKEEEEEEERICHPHKY